MRQFKKIGFAGFAALLLAGFAVSPAFSDGYYGNGAGTNGGGLESTAMPGSAGGADGMSAATLAERRAELMERAKREDLAAAVGHYARARSLLIAAIREFDNGYKLARPDSLIDSAQWRSILIDRAEDLERILAPQPRLTDRGSRFEPDTRLMGTGRTR